MANDPDFDPAADGPILEPAGCTLTYKSYCKRRRAYGFTVDLTEAEWHCWDLYNKRLVGEPWLPFKVALYEDQAPFQWVHFTAHGLVRGGLSLAALGTHFPR